MVSQAVTQFVHDHITKLAQSTPLRIKLTRAVACTMGANLRVHTSVRRWIRLCAAYDARVCIMYNTRGQTALNQMRRTSHGAARVSP